MEPYQISVYYSMARNLGCVAALPSCGQDVSEHFDPTVAGYVVSRKAMVGKHYALRASMVLDLSRAANRICGAPPPDLAPAPRCRIADGDSRLLATLELNHLQFPCAMTFQR